MFHIQERRSHSWNLEGITGCVQMSTSNMYHATAPAARPMITMLLAGATALRIK
jgi:hypothetical protein